jgi:hypothetical protein
MTGENVEMAVSTAAKVTTPDEAMRSVAAAMQDAATTASEDRAEGGLPVDAQSLPQENALMRGFRDGGREAAEQLRDG